MASSEITLIEHKIRLARDEYKYLNKQVPKNRDELEVKETEINSLILKYEEIAGQPHVNSLQDLALELCEDYYADMDDVDNDDRKRLITRYYHVNCTALIIGYGRLNGRDKIIDNILTKFKNIRMKHDNIKVVLDRIPPQGRMMVINCTATLKLNNDAPRKIKTIFEIEKCSADDSHPLVIVSELFQVLDSRPLYHHPEISKIPRGTNDNWEPQFKPAFIEPEIVMRIAEETKAEEKKGETGGDEESLQEGESYEDDDESVQASIMSGSVESGVVGSNTRSPKHKQQHHHHNASGSELHETLVEQLNEDTVEDGATGEPSDAKMESNNNNEITTKQVDDEGKEGNEQIEEEDEVVEEENLAQ